MRMKFTKTMSALFIIVMLNGCVSSTPNINEATYKKDKATKGTVILGVNWGRIWKCGEYDNAQLLSFGFDHLPAKSLSDDSKFDVILYNPSVMTSMPRYITYALQVDKGDYALSQFDVKYVKSMNDIRYYMPHKKALIERSGTFNVKAGETVYIGNFSLSCRYEPPIIWRYYEEGKDKFNKYVTAIKKLYPFLKDEDIKFRLFKTSILGNNYSLTK